MLILPIQTPLLTAGDTLGNILSQAEEIRAGDIVVVSSKAVATIEGAPIDLSALTPGTQAKTLSKKTGLSPTFCEAIVQETDRLNGKILHACPGAILTELKPDGLMTGTFLTANAGLDQSNVAEGFAVGWPRDVVGSVKRLKTELEACLRNQTMQKKQRNQKNLHSSASSDSSVSSDSSCLAIILSDSNCRPRRLGVTAQALAVSGIDPVVSQVGSTDLFGRALRMTSEATADQLATAANAVMGNTAQSTPAAIIRDHGLELNGYEGWVGGIEGEKDLFGTMDQQD